MAEVVVTRAHRQRAAEAVFGTWFNNSDESVWIETGVVKAIEPEMMTAVRVASHIAFAEVIAVEHAVKAIATWVGDTTAQLRRKASDKRGYAGMERSILDGDWKTDALRASKEGA